MLWDFFDKIYIISIPESKRKNELVQNLRNAKIKNYEIIDFQGAKKTQNDGSELDLSLIDIFKHSFCDSTCKNITNNHLKIIQSARMQNLNNVLIFEDDVEFPQNLDFEKLSRAIDWLKNNKWDMFYFGYISFPTPVLIPVNRDITRVYSPYLAHAYAVNRSGINYITDNVDLFQNNHVDSIYGKLPLKKYGIYPNICFQSSDPALYKRAMEKVGVNISLKTFTKISEKVCITIPFLILLFLIYIIYYFVFRKK